MHIEVIGGAGQNHKEIFWDTHKGHEMEISVSINTVGLAPCHSGRLCIVCVCVLPPAAVLSSWDTDHMARGAENNSCGALGRELPPTLV